ncbi:MAG: class II fumarate hydratase [Verrucomicrobiota bacterium]
MNDQFRTESDSMGPMQIPADAYYGAQTARAVENFPISNLRFPRSFIRALGLIKKHAALTNQELGGLKPELAEAIARAAQEVAEGKWDAQFVVDIFQTGSGTSTNMNANEVIANRAIELLGGKRGEKRVHPNDHVNRGQSSNDVIPTAIHIAALEAMERRLIPALGALEQALQRKAAEFHDVLKIGRTHLQDATPIRLGQEFGGYASQIHHGVGRLRAVEKNLGELALGGTAVGTGINTHAEFARRTIARLAAEMNLPLLEAEDHFEAQGGRDALVETSAMLKTVAISLIKVANDIRLLGSGPRLGLGELRLPATQPGSSIMPGKVNPVMCEMMLQVCAQVLGNDAAVTFSGSFGNFELNVMMPVMAHNLLQSIELLAAACEVFARRCVAGLEADREKCRNNLELSLSNCTVLAPVIGYDKAAKIAKVAFETNRTIRQVALEISGLEPARLDVLLDPAKQTEPGGE